MSIQKIDINVQERTPIQFTEEHIYERVNWKDNVTPIDQYNLNKADKALDYLLGENTGYIKNIISKLNQESSSSKTDFINLVNTINALIDSINHEDENIKSRFDTKLSDQLEAILAVINDAVETIHTDVDHDLNELKTYLEELIAALRQDDEDHFNTAMNAIAELSSRVSQNTEDIAGIKTDIKTLEEEIANISSQAPIPDNVITSDDELILICGTATEVLH